MAGASLLPTHWIHHVSLHVPLVLPAVLTCLGLLTWRDEEVSRHVKFMRWLGLFCLGATTVAILAGMASAPGLLGGDGSAVLRDHRDLGVTAWCVILLAALSHDAGVRQQDVSYRRLGTCLWGVATLAVIGAGHWGGLHEHAKHIPF